MSSILQNKNIKININPKKELFKWGPTEFKLIYGSFFIETILTRVCNYYPWHWPANLCIFDHGKTVWINDNLELKKVGLKYLKKYFLNLENYKTHWQKWEEWTKEHEKTAQELEQVKLQNISDKEFYNLLRHFYDFNIRFWLIVHVPEIANWGGEYLLTNKLKSLFKEKFEEYLEILSAPIKFSFFQQEELDLLSLDSIKDKKEFQKKLKQHAKEYHWLLNSYGGNRILKVDYFADKLKELLKEKSAKQKIKEIKDNVKKNKTRKDRLIKKLRLSKNLVLIAEQLSQSIWWQDLRKGYIWQMNYFWDKFLQEIAKRTDWKFNELQWCYGFEILSVVKNKNKINKKEINKRKKYYAFYAEKGKFKDFTQVQQVKKLISTYLKVATGNTKELKGLVVSRGKTAIMRGQVKIINNPFKESRKMVKGDILVAGMTSPEFIIVMRKAKAIITDHGGMTSHAAIVSRELGVPCIIGTKIATKILHDGQIVEVDANKGIIRIIK